MVSTWFSWDTQWGSQCGRLCEELPVWMRVSAPCPAVLPEVSSPPPWVSCPRALGQLRPLLTLGHNYVKGPK